MVRQAFGATPGGALFSSCARKLEAQGTAAYGGIGDSRGGCEERSLEIEPLRLFLPKRPDMSRGKMCRSTPVGPCSQPNRAIQFWQ